jgi:23S rRNA (uracil1939-C5)-methyltransferase
VVPIVECHLPEPPLAELWPHLPASPGGGRLILRRGTEGPPAVWEEEGAAHGAPLAAAVQFNLPCGSFRVSPGSFFQVNTAMAARLAEEVLRELQGRLPEGARRAEVLDLYCGVGLFSRALAPHVRRVTGVELSSAACSDFRHNLRGQDNASLLPGAVAKVLPGLSLRPDAAVVDPPRPGLGPGVVRTLAALAPALLLYVSCDPATLARDARELGRQGYALRSIRLLDLFPQTYHLETLSVWSRAPASGILQP